MNTVRIIVSETIEWKLGNLFGTISKEIGNEILIIELSKSINLKNFSSKILELHSINKNSNFRDLKNNYSVIVNGFLINTKNNSKEFILIGSVTLD